MGDHTYDSDCSYCLGTPRDRDGPTLRDCSLVQLESVKSAYVLDGDEVGEARRTESRPE